MLAVMIAKTQIVENIGYEYFSISNQLAHMCYVIVAGSCAEFLRVWEVVLLAMFRKVQFTLCSVNCNRIFLKDDN